MSPRPDDSAFAARRRIPELDGLRGLAVAAVVAYHAWPEALPGGWLGVSVFFTLSGFLITGILIRDHESTRASLGHFWLTRARRLLPAALLTIGAAVGATALVDPDSVRRVAGDALASIWYVQNWRAAAAPGGYGEIFDSTLRPLAHMWSLSIEEQAYLILPLLTLWLGPKRMLAVGATLSVIGIVVWWGSPDAYYATPVRMFEILAGGALAIWTAEGRRIRTPAFVGVIAGAGILAGSFLIGESDDIVSRGVLPVAAVLSALVIATLVNRPFAAMCVRPLSWLGHRSYAIYLFHWPLLVLWDVPPLVAVVASLVLAEVSHHVLEWPIRSQRIAIPRPVLTFATTTLVVVGIAVAGLALGPRAASDAEIAAATAAALADLEVAREVAPTTTVAPAEVRPTTEPAGDIAATTTTTTTTLPDTRIPLPAGPTVMILGDSTADAIEPAVSGWVELIGGTPIDAGDLGCSPMFSETGYTRWYTNLIPDPTPCRERVPAEADLVLIFDHGVPLFDHFDREADAWTDLGSESFVAEMRAEYASVIADAAAAGAPVVFTTPPTPWASWGETTWFHSGTEIIRRENYTTLVTELAAAYDDVHLIEFGSFVDADEARYPREDGIHLDAETGAIHAVVDLVAPAFRLEG